MSMLSGNQEETPVTVTTMVLVHCNSCGKDYYTQIPAGETVDSVVNNMNCSCGDSQMVVIHTVNGASTLGMAP